MYDGVIDPDTATGLAGAALEQSLGALRRVEIAAGAADASAKAAAATQAAVTALLTAAGVDHRWIGTAVQIRLPDGSYGPLTDLKGPKGDTGLSPELVVGTVVSGAVPSVEFIGADPRIKLVNFVVPQGSPGLSGWTPILAIVIDGARSLLQIQDWIGGTGTKPPVGLFVGSSGYVASTVAAADVRGLAGSVADTGTTTAGHLAVWSAAHTIGDGGALSAFGQSLVAAATAAAVKALLAIGIADVAGAQAALGYTAENIAIRGQANGYAALDGTGKIPLSQLPAGVADAFHFVSVWDASTNNPPLASGIGVKGALYKVGTAGSTNLDGKTQWNVGDSALFDGTTWDKIDGISNEVITVAGLFGNITSAALKVALAIAVADISGLGGAATRDVGLSAGQVAAGDDARLSGNEKTANKGAVNGYASLDATAKVPSAQLPIPLYQVTGVTAVSANTTILATAFGVMYDVTGSPTLILPAKGNFSAANPFETHVRKRDGSGVATIQCAAGDTFANGKTTMAVYQEHVTLFCLGGVWYAPPGGRQTGWITLQSQVALTGQSLASYTIATGFADPDIAEIEIKFSNLVLSTTGIIGLRVIKGGVSMAGSTYSLDTLDQSSTTVSAASGTTQTQIGLTAASTANPISGDIRVWDAISAAAKDQRISLTSWVPGARRKVDFEETTAGVLQGLNFLPAAGTIASLTYTLKGLRA